MATDAIIAGLELSLPARDRLYQRIAKRIAYHQKRNARARVSHRRATIRKLHRNGFKLSGLPRCDENTS
jgi:hypothetical protein